MKKILNGVRYDTEGAVEIGTASYANSGDFQHWEATLYVTPKSKRFFIAGSGGPMSRFSQSVGQNEWAGGSDLIPMSKEDALQWAEKYLDTEEFEKHFEGMIEDA